jgi:Phosphotransferase enzyme family
MTAFELEQPAPAAGKASAIPAADRLIAGLPAIDDGEADASYLSAALQRAGRPARIGDLDVAGLGGGRISANVLSLKADAGAFVLKKFLAEPWRVSLFGTAFNEPALWTGGFTRSLPAPLSCPTIDVAFHRERGECWMLMDDVSAGVAPRGTFEEGSFRLLLDGLARLHARNWGQGADSGELPILTLEQHTAMFADPCAAVGGRAGRPDWVPEVLDKVFLFRTYVPVLLDVLGSADGDFYLDLCEHRERWLAPLSKAPQTVIHGDLRRANIAILPSAISLFDWDFACRAPAAADLAWYWLLHFWCYPPSDGRTPEDREPHWAYYVERLNEALGRQLDRAAFERAWDLSWLKVLAQVGFCLADPLVGAHTQEDVARVRAQCRKAIDRAKRIADTHAA